MSTAVKQVFYNEGPTTVTVRLLSDGAALDLTAYDTVALELRDRPITLGTDTPQLSVTGWFVDQAGGRVSFDVAAAHTVSLGLGRFSAQVVCSNAGGDRIKSPLFTLVIKGGTSGV